MHYMHYESNERHWWLDQCSTDRSFEMVYCECKEFSLAVSIFSIFSMKVLGLGTNWSNKVLNWHWHIERWLRNNSWHLNRSIPTGFPFCISYPLCDINGHVRWRTSLIAEFCSIGWRLVQSTAFRIQIGKQPDSLHYHTNIFLPFHPVHFHYCPPVSAHLAVVLLFFSALSCHLCFALSPSGCLSWENLSSRETEKDIQTSACLAFIHTQTLYTQLSSTLLSGTDGMMLRFHIHTSISTLLHLHPLFCPWFRLLSKSEHGVDFGGKLKVIAHMLS